MLVTGNYHVIWQERIVGATKVATHFDGLKEACEFMEEKEKDDEVIVVGVVVLIRSNTYKVAREIVLEDGTRLYEKPKRKDVNYV